MKGSIFQFSSHEIILTWNKLFSCSCHSSTICINPNDTATGSETNEIQSIPIQLSAQITSLPNTKAYPKVPELINRGQEQQVFNTVKYTQQTNIKVRWHRITSETTTGV